MKRVILSLGIATALVATVWAAAAPPAADEWSDAEHVEFQNALHQQASKAIENGTANGWWQKAAMLAVLDASPETTQLWSMLSEQALQRHDFRMLRAMTLLAPLDISRQAFAGASAAKTPVLALQHRYRAVLNAWQALEPSNLAPAILAGKPLSGWQLSEYLYHDTGAFDLAAALRADYPAGLALPRLPGEGQAYTDADLVWVAAVGHATAVATDYQGCGRRDSVVDENDPTRCLELGRVLAYGGTTISDVAVGMAILEAWHEAQAEQTVPVGLLEQKLAYHQLMERFDYSADEDAVLLGQWQELTARHGEWGAMQHLQEHCPVDVSFNQCMQQEVLL